MCVRFGMYVVWYVCVCILVCVCVCEFGMCVHLGMYVCEFDTVYDVPIQV